MGKKFEYLGIMVDYMKKIKITLSMYEYIDKMLAGLPTDMNGVSRYQPWDIYLTSTQTRQNCQRARHNCSIT